MPTPPTTNTLVDLFTNRLTAVGGHVHLAATSEDAARAIQQIDAKRSGGTAWISELDHEVVKVDMHAKDDVTIGWGLLGRLHEGSRLTFQRRKFENVWLPARITFDATGRTLLLRKFERGANTRSHTFYRWFNELPVLVLLAIVILVVVKPF